MTDTEEKILEEIAGCLNYIRKGGIPKEISMQLAICQDKLEFLIGKQK